MSLDGYVTGPDVSPEEPMGPGGVALHDWMFKGRSAAESDENAPTAWSKRAPLASHL